MEMDLVLGVLGKIIESSNMQLKLAAFAKLAKTGTKTDEV